MFFSNEYIRRLSVTKDLKTNIFVFRAERVKSLLYYTKIICQNFNFALFLYLEILWPA